MESATKELTIDDARMLTVNDWLWASEAGSQTTSGVRIGPTNAFESSPVWQAIDIISGDISQLPFKAYERTGEGGRKEALTHSAWTILHEDTGEMSSDVWVATMVSQALLYGNSYSRVITNNAGRVEALQFLHADRVEPIIEDGIRMYLVNFDQDLHGRAGVKRIGRSQMIHVQGLTINEWGGMSLIKHARQAFGRLRGSELFADDYNRQGFKPAGYFSTEAKFKNPEARSAFEQRVREMHQGAGQFHKTMVLEQGMKFVPVATSPKDAEYLGRLNLSVKDVCRYFNLPPHKLGISDRIAYNSLEEENRAYLQSTLGKWIKRLEKQCTIKLFSSKRYYAEFNRDAWLRGDTKSKAEAYKTGVEYGWMSRNEVRQRENLNPVEGGDVMLVPLNLGPVNQLDEQPTDEAPPEENNENARAAAEMLTERVIECVHLLGNSLTRNAKTPAKFLSYMNEFEEKFRPKLTRKLIVSARTASVMSGIVVDPNKVVDAILDETIQRMLGAKDAATDDGLKTSVSDSIGTLEMWAPRFVADYLYEGASCTTKKSETAAVA